MAGGLGKVDALFGYDRNLWNQPREPVGKDPVSGQVCVGHRRSVAFVQDAHHCRVHGQNGRSGPDHQVGQRFHQLSRRLAVDHECLSALCWQHAPSQCIKPASMCDSPWSALSADLQEHFMSGISSPGPAPDGLELAALLCSRVCHDLISPVGAIVNGLEVLDDDPKPEDREFALDLIRKSAKTASARLQFCRLAFGAAGSAGAQIDLGDAQTMARGHLEDAKTKIVWNLPRVLLPKNRVKLLLNMMVIAQQTIPRGGVLTVDSIGEGGGSGFRVSASGLNARLPQNIADMLSVNSTASVDAHAVQPYYTRLLAQACGLSVTLAPDGEKVIVTAA